MRPNVKVMKNQCLQNFDSMFRFKRINNLSEKIYEVYIRTWGHNVNRFLHVCHLMSLNQQGGQTCLILRVKNIQTSRSFSIP